MWPIWIGPVSFAYGMRQDWRRFILCVLSSLTGVTAWGAESAVERLGERLFDDPRFAHRGPLTAPAVSCRTCHAGKDAAPAPVARNPVPARSDGQLTTPRNAQAVADSLTPVASGWGLLHWDGEFARAEDLVKETFLGRNFGWLPDERTNAMERFALVIRKDEGDDALAARTAGLSYLVLLRGEDPRIPDALRLPAELRIDPARASDEALTDACARLVVAFIRSQGFSRDASGRHNGSSYDAFLEANRLPRAPAKHETPHEYARRLHHAIAALKIPRFIDEPGRGEQTRDQPFRFGELELRGMRVFFRGTLGQMRATGAGNCAECHVPPAFTDGAFHNTGSSQDAYDAAHGPGAFARLTVPDLRERTADFNPWLPPTAQHPQATGRYRAATDGGTRQADLGLWNVYANPDLPAPQAAIERKLNPEGRLRPDDVLSLTLARFKTPSLRALDRSAPYLHNGSQQSLEDVIRFYQRLSDLAQANAMRNPPPEYAIMKLDEADVAPLAAFLRALNEE